jgi:hypothetical protein
MRSVRPSMWLLVLAFGFALVGGGGAAAADDRFHPVPGGEGLELRVVSYGHGAHGEMVVEVRNAGAAEARFVASGLYFLPDDNDAAQRVGMVGAMRVGSEAARASAIAVASGQTRRVRFDVFCIDEHRHAPGHDQAFTLAASRMPPALIVAIDDATASVRSRIKVAPTADQLADLQGDVWQARRDVRVRLLGEQRRR